PAAREIASRRSCSTLRRSTNRSGRSKATAEPAEPAEHDVVLRFLRALRLLEELIVAAFHLPQRAPLALVGRARRRHRRAVDPLHPSHLDLSRRRNRRHIV